MGIGISNILILSFLRSLFCLFPPGELIRWAKRKFYSNRYLSGHVYAQDELDRLYAYREFDIN